MPYKDAEEQKRVKREYAAKRRGSTNSDVDPAQIVDPTSRKVDPGVDPFIDKGGAAWQHVRDFISEPCPGMTRLERMQRIAGSLGKNAKHVWFGDLTVADIGAVIGTLPPVIQRGQ